MSADLTPFLFEDHPVRTIQQDGQPWFVAADICRCIGIQNPTMAVANLDEDEES
ncbi:Bro-N domain-containing protein [Magnetospirillum fulvum]|uniref:Phage protein n=1 Tax=Magnetospirillum fulvum MGU-K5 TaxID=1316936 RepID=S9TDP1_MAGFU|nr:BRO family protein [Magnetospirillum fulvum]EPY00366.1 phage protein [Magnetospirillum fulvum MGU-K5]